MRMMVFKVTGRYNRLLGILKMRPDTRIPTRCDVAFAYETIHVEVVFPEHSDILYTLAILFWVKSTAG